MSTRRINRDNEDLIGARFRRPGSVIINVVEDIDPLNEGILIALNTLSNKGFQIDAATVRATLLRCPS